MIKSFLFGIYITIIPFTNDNNLCGQMASGCYYDKTIYINLESEDIKKTFYHELGHAVHDGDTEILEIIKDYPALMDMELATSYILGGQNDKLLDERVANYFALYLMDDNFEKDYPVLFNYFENKR